MRSKRQYTLIAAKPHLLSHLQASLCWNCLDFFLVDVGLALELLARSGVIGLGPEFRGVHEEITACFVRHGLCRTCRHGTL